MSADEEYDRNKPVAILDASGGIGRRVAERLLAASHAVRGQTRDPARLAEFAGRIEIQAFDPCDAARLSSFARGCAGVVFALGADRSGATTLFSDVTAALIPAMKAGGVRRLNAITGVGAG